MSEPNSSDLVEVLRSAGLNLGRAWAWMDAAGACVEAMRAARAVAP